MAEYKPLPGGIEGEIRRLIIKRLVTDDPAEKAKIMSRLVAAESCRAFLAKLPGQEYLVHDGGTISAVERR